MRARDAFLPLLSTDERTALDEKLSKTGNSKRKGKGKASTKKSKAEANGDDEEDVIVVDDEEEAEEQPMDDADAATLSAPAAADVKRTWSDILELCHIVPREVHRLRFKYHDMEAAVSSCCLAYQQIAP